MTEKQVWNCQHSLMLAGYVRLFANFNVADVDPDWSRAAPEFTITPLGLKWWLMRKYGTRYSELVRGVKRTKEECLRNGITSVAAWAEKLDLPLLLVQKIMLAEHL